MFKSTLAQKASEAKRSQTLQPRTITDLTVILCQKKITRHRQFTWLHI